MATKKVKGQKVDLASFNVASGTATLPTGPDPSRQQYNTGYGNRRREDDDNSGGKWSDRNNNNSDRGGGYDDSRENRYNNNNSQRGYEEMTPSQTDNNWRTKSSDLPPSRPSRPMQSQSQYQSSSSRTEETTARPDHFRTNINPRSDNGTATAASNNTSIPASEEPSTDVDVDDKWSKAFKNMSTTTTNSETSRRGDGGNFNNDRRGFSDRGGGGGGNRRYEGGGGHRSRGDRNNNNDEEIDDPRFAGKFSSGGGDRGDRGGGGYRDRGGDRGDRGDRGGGYRDRGGGQQHQQHQERTFGPLPTAPRSAMVDVPRPPVVPVSKGPTEEDLRLIEEAKAAKLLKAQAKEEAERKRLEDKERQREEEESRKVAEKEEQLKAVEAAGSLLDSGLKGGELVKLLSESVKRPTGGALLREILERQTDQQDILSSKWWTKSEYGPALSQLVGSSPGDQGEGSGGSSVVDSQKKVLLEVQGYCYKRGFPKVEVKGQQQKLITVLFNLLLSNQLVSPDAFLAWCDDNNNEDPGRTDAIVHTTNFIQSLRDALAEGDEEEEDEDDEVDAPRQIVK